MSFIQREATKGRVYAPGYFLADVENCVRETRTILANDASVVTSDTGEKYMPMGATYKEENAVVGVVYEDVNVTSGDMPGSVVTKGTIYKDRLVTQADAEALEALGFKVIESSPAVTRPEDFDV